VKISSLRRAGTFLKVGLYGSPPHRRAANKSKTALFNRGNWQKLSPNMLDIRSLRILSNELPFRYIKQKLPRLPEEFDQTYEETRLSLQALGQEYSTVNQQKECLTQLRLQFYDTKDKVTGCNPCTRPARGLSAHCVWVFLRPTRISLSSLYIYI
jgi:hypothetical protein